MTGVALLTVFVAVGDTFGVGVVARVAVAVGVTGVVGVCVGGVFNTI